MPVQDVRCSMAGEIDKLTGSAAATLPAPIRIVHHHPARAHEVAARALDGEVVDGDDRVAGADLRDRGRARDALRGHRADGVALGEVAGGDPAAVARAILARAVARVERLDERDGLGVGAGVECRCARPRPRDEERVLAGGGDGGLVAAARLARVDGDVVDRPLEEPRGRGGDDGGGRLARRGVDACDGGARLDRLDRRGKRGGGGEDGTS